VFVNTDFSRRTFIKKSTMLAAGAAVVSMSPAILRAAGANDRLRVAVIGCNGRGKDVVRGLLGVPNLEISHICDVDGRAIKKGLEAAAEKQSAPTPKTESDLRRVLEDKDVDAVAIAMPDHWHAPASILACAAGKHVYVEKPGSHNGREGELVVAAARKHKRVVQLGIQRRSWPWVIEAIEAVRGGEIGKVPFARCWYTNKRGPIGRGKRVPVPDWLDYTLWQGPAPERPYQDNVVHYKWHWFWHWGTGELGNNGVHALDLARWGMELDSPRRVTCGGGRYFGDDDWETPDTMVLTCDYGHKAVVWEGQSCAPRGFENASFGCTFHGDKGAMVIAGSEAVIYDLKGMVLRRIDGKQKDLFQFDSIHFANFADAIRGGASLRAEIEEGQNSALLCHLGNIAWRTGQTVDYDPVRKQVVGSSAQKLWEREYRHGWKPTV